MSDIASDRLEPASGVMELQGQEPRPEPRGREQRRPRPVAAPPSEPAEMAEIVPHKVDSRI